MESSPFHKTEEYILCGLYSQTLLSRNAANCFLISWPTISHVLPTNSLPARSRIQHFDLVRNYTGTTDGYHRLATTPRRREAIQHQLGSQESGSEGPGLHSHETRRIITFRHSTFGQCVCTLVVDSDRPYATEADLFWRCISKNDMKDLIERLTRLLVPSYLERYGAFAIMSLFLTDASDVLCTNPVEAPNPTGYNMRMREINLRSFQSICDHAVRFSSSCYYYLR